LKPFRISLIWKLVLINLLGVSLVILLAWLVIDHFASFYFMNLMKAYSIEPELLHQMFLEAIHRYLLLSMGLGLAVVTFLSHYITQRVMHSLTEMTAIVPRLAGGDYSGRVSLITNDEVGELGQVFNQMLESLAAIEKMRKDLVANVAHELRTPLNNLRGELEAMQDGLSAPTKKHINSLHEEILRLVRLVDGLHRLSQIDAGMQKLKKEAVDLQELAGRIVTQFEKPYSEKGIHFSAETFPASISANADQMMQVMHNLLENILRYTPSGGAASLKMQQEEDQIQMAFANSGEGISKQDLPHIFERFFRGEKSRSRACGGAGIGLAIVKQVVEAHGGLVKAESQPGQTEVLLSFPKA